MIQSVPVPKLVVLSGDASSGKPQADGPSDFRWGLVEEFLRSRELSVNSQKAYRRSFKQFLAWTDKGWHELTARDMDRYKAHLKGKRTSKGKSLSAATINQSLYALQSLFRWLTVRDYVQRDPMLQMEKLKPDPVRSLQLVATPESYWRSSFCESIQRDEPHYESS